MRLARLLLLATFAIISTAAHAHGPTPQKAEEKITVTAPPAKVWDAIKDFGKFGKFTNELTGFFVPAKPGAKGGPVVVRGSIVQTSEDLYFVPPDKQQPKYTTGFFVLEPVK